MIEVAFRLVLNEDEDTQGLTEGRVYFNAAPQNERRPRVVLRLVSAVPGHVFGGKGGWTKGRMQADCLAPTYEQAKELAAAVNEVLDGFSGNKDETEIAFIETENKRDIPMLPLEGSATPTFGVSIDCRFMYTE